MSKVLILSASDVKNLLSMRDVISAVEDAFRSHGRRTMKLAPITLTLIDKFEGEHEIKSGYVEDYSIGTKVLTYYKHNQSRYGLPALSGIIVLHALEDGQVLAVMDAGYITSVRTGAAGALGAKYLARKNSENVAVMGAGMQGRSQVAALNEVLGIKSVKVYDVDRQRAVDYVAEMTAKFDFKIEKADSPRMAIRDADIIVTATPSNSPHVLNEWIQAGVHISAIGADSPGKQELDPAIVARAKLVVDDMSQCVERGEIQTAIRLGLLGRQDIHAELSEIILERKPGRANDKEITLFDATGLAIQDITTSYRAYRLAQERGIGTTCELS